MSNFKKKISLICIIIFTITFFATTVNASMESDRKNFWDSGYKNIGKTIGVAANYKNAQSTQFPFNLYQFETYCIQHKSGFKTGKYKIHYYIELDGDTATKFNNSGTAVNTWKNKQLNGTLEYILAEEDFQKSGRINAKEDIDKFEKEHAAQTSSGSCMSIRNIALWRFMQTWMGTNDKNSNGAINKLGIEQRWRYDYSPSGKVDSWNQAAKDFVNRAKKAASTSNNPSVTSTYKKVSNVQENKNIIGPFKINYTGNGLSIKVYNKSDKEISKVEYYSDRKCTKKIELKDMKPGTIEFYIKNNSDELIKNVKFKANGTKIKAQLWFLAYNDKFALNAGQAIMIAKSSKEDSGSNEEVVEIEYKTGDLKIIKTDEETGKRLEGVQFKIHCGKGWIQDKLDENGNYVYKTDAEKGFESAKVFPTDKNGEILVKDLPVLKNGYNVYEVGTPDEYELKEQADSKKGYIYNSERNYIFIKEVIYIKEGQTTPIELKVTNKKHKVGKLRIVKTDEITNEKLPGVKFKLYAVGKGWLQATYIVPKDNIAIPQWEKDYTYYLNDIEYKADKDGGYDTAVEFMTDKNGEVFIANLPILEKGYIVYETGYESKAIEGYNIKEQADSKKGYKYNKEKNAIRIDQAIILQSDKEAPVELKVTNQKKRVDNLGGMVWVDRNDGKSDSLDNIYKNKSFDTLKEGIRVYLKSLVDNKDLITDEKANKDENGHYVITDKNGHYEFNNLNLSYSDVENAYIEFKYDNSKYTLVEPFEGSDARVNSKAKIKELTVDNLNDEKIKNKESKAYPGIASTEMKTGALTTYYDQSTYTVSNINLGLVENLNVSYNLEETLEYVKVKMNGYTYTYKYGKGAGTESNDSKLYSPMVRSQDSAISFRTKLYLTDVAYNAETSSENLQVYVVYSIGVQNLANNKEDNRYVEQKLYLNSLTNTFDSRRYELCTDKNMDDKEATQFKLWTTDNKTGENGEIVAKYDIQKGVYKDGIDPDKTIKSYIQFKMKDEMLKTILEGNLTEEIVERVPTWATANGYHDYLRTDNVWNDANIIAYEKSKENKYAKKNSDNKKYYVHRTTNKNAESSNVFIRLQLKEQRTLSGVVFEDTLTQKSDGSDKNNLGDGILSDTETNRADKVKVQLLNRNKQDIADLYQIEKVGTKTVVKYDNGALPKAETYSDENGEFTFTGVAPGYYYIRFTYSDGTQKIMPAGSVITSKDYKSTIINTSDNDSVIKNAMEEKNIDQVLSNKSDEHYKKLVEWYKYLENKKYSVAVDDINKRSLIDEYEYREDGKVFKNGTEVTEEELRRNELMTADTPIIGISIENDVADSSQATKDGNRQAPEYDEFNFGLIKQEPTIIKLDKRIKNVKFTNQVGTTLVSADPTDITANYVTALDNLVGGGSKYAKLEIDPENIYGSNIELTYQITISNETTKDYIEQDNSEEFGYYYKYGIVTEGQSELKKITVREVQDEIDPKFNLNSVPKTVKQTKSDSKEIRLSPESTTIKMTGWESLASSEKTSMEYTVTSLLSQDDDSNFGNDAKVTSLSLDSLTTLASNSEWNADSTTFAITPSTGANRDYTELIVGIIALVVAAVGFIAIKKKVL